MSYISLINSHVSNCRLRRCRSLYRWDIDQAGSSRNKCDPGALCGRVHGCAIDRVCSEFGTAELRWWKSENRQRPESQIAATSQSWRYDLSAKESALARGNEISPSNLARIIAQIWRYDGFSSGQSGLGTGIECGPKTQATSETGDPSQLVVISETSGSHQLAFFTTCRCAHNPAKGLKLFGKIPITSRTGGSHNASIFATARAAVLGCRLRC